MYRLILLIFALAAVSFFSCSQNDQYKAGQEVFLDAMSDTTTLLVDVRTPEEFSVARIPGAVNYDIKSEDFAEQIENIDRSTPMYLYCRSGRRSNTAAVKLKELGFEQVYDLEGGILDWTEKGHRTDSVALEVTH